MAEDGSLSTTSENPEPNQMQLATAKATDLRAKSGSKKEWTTVNTDLSKFLNELRNSREETG